MSWQWFLASARPLSAVFLPELSRMLCTRWQTLSVAGRPGRSGSQLGRPKEGSWLLVVTAHPVGTGARRLTWGTATPSGATIRRCVRGPSSSSHPWELPLSPSRCRGIGHGHCATLQESLGTPRSHRPSCASAPSLRSERDSRAQAAGSLVFHAGATHLMGRWMDG